MRREDQHEFVPGFRDWSNHVNIAEWQKRMALTNCRDLLDNRNADDLQRYERIQFRRQKVKRFVAKCRALLKQQQVRLVKNPLSGQNADLFT